MPGIPAWVSSTIGVIVVITVILVVIVRIYSEPNASGSGAAKGCRQYWTSREAGCTRGGDQGPLPGFGFGV